MFLSPYKTTVSVAAASKDMTLKATVKAELGITVTTYDDLIDVMIQQASAAIVSYCNREFASETVVSLFRLDRRATSYSSWRAVETLMLERVPVTSITSVDEDGTTLTADDYEVDAATGFLWRLDGDDNRSCWSATKITVTQVGGYVMLTTLPQDLERACLDLVKSRWFARARDPMVKAAEVPGVLSEQYWIGDAPGTGDGIPASIQLLLDPYRRIVI